MSSNSQPVKGEDSLAEYVGRRCVRGFVIGIVMGGLVGRFVSQRLGFALVGGTCGAILMGLSALLDKPRKKHEPPHPLGPISSSGDGEPDERHVDKAALIRSIAKRKARASDDRSQP